MRQNHSQKSKVNFKKSAFLPLCVVVLAGVLTGAVLLVTRPEKLHYQSVALTAYRAAPHGRVFTSAKYDAASRSILLEIGLQNLYDFSSSIYVTDVTLRNKNIDITAKYNGVDVVTKDVPYSREVISIKKHLQGGTYTVRTTLHEVNINNKATGTKDIKVTSTLIVP